ncbi:hypothetical protein A0J57_05570 [Sphingobium sp. 22B]|uniref:ArdC family protein n=1 Tax=Sphingobium TaxID=165695 RepID=UPI0007834993|nr:MULTISPECIES: zincin-like metallopeptidase domain-containing protein [Sphingobium]OAP32382.1 hypothetical protein A8O16_07685 [Sphingobium sp. 20006FA]KXU33366.1 hypothetical protein AXW74_01890 [Sphingobium sp. AM]KYC33197.1 hypothetical protein A0J57_05570 [Sphingobium sp. 22B]MCB4863127.1 ssDNA-binding domain-containing protein [Sphingobium sp. PNB]MEC6701468.1 zincin-like metallopeptidase domain-containing protein [Sphingobium sp. SJ10-10]
MASKKTSREVAAEITALIIRKLEEGVAPWKRPWAVTGAGGRPLRHCGTPYTGINNLYLWAIADACGYRSRFWMTRRQAEELGGNVRSGESGSLSVYYSAFTKRKNDPATGEERDRKFRFLRHYVVYNCDQVDGLPDFYYPPVLPDTPIDPSARQAEIDRFFNAIPADVRHGGNEAYYNPSRDYIQLPAPRSFKSMDYYASVRAHESLHWSGSASRLARVFGKRFGDKAYCFEELVAEIGSGLICADLGLPHELHDSHASYVGQWISVLKADTTAIIHAASKAEQAFTYLRQFSESTDEVNKPMPAAADHPAALAA